MLNHSGPDCDSPTPIEPARDSVWPGLTTPDEHWGWAWVGEGLEAGREVEGDGWLSFGSDMTPIE